MATTVFVEDPTLYRPLAVGVALSLLIHLMLLLFLSVNPEPKFITPIVVDIIMPEAKLSTNSQIVTPPEKRSGEIPHPEEPVFKSEIDSSAKRSQIKRGDGLDAGPVVGKRGGETPPRPRPKTSREESSAALKYLMLDQDTLERALKESEKEAERGGPKKESSPKNQDRGSQLSNYEAFSRPTGSGAAFLGSAGSPDYLPNLPDGDITLLNTKASKFAVFVRRVATQVFSELRRAGWESLFASDIASMNDFSTVRAVLAKDGTLLSIALESTSGSGRFDEVVLAAAQKGARDPNPPHDALAPDGNFHFIFKARSWVRGMGDRRHGGYLERRWLLLATGLE